MAAKNGKAATSAQVQTFLKGQLTGAQKAFTKVETEAQKVLTTLVARGQESRKDLEALLTRVNPSELNTLLDTAQVKKFSKKATQAGTEVRKRLDGLQARVVEAVGVASQTQVREINKEISKISKKLDAVLSGGAKKAAAAQRPDTRA